MKMLKLGNATQQALLYAKHWQCPVCAESAPPWPMLSATAETRPYGFNVIIVMDVKYLKNSEQKRALASSMVDVGTG